jgi:glutaredoxin
MPKAKAQTVQQEPHTSFGQNGSCPDCEADKSTLTDDECDFIIRRLLWKLRDSTSPIDFFREMKRGVVFEVSDASRARDLVRLFAKAEGAK